MRITVVHLTRRSQEPDETVPVNCLRRFFPAFPGSFQASRIAGRRGLLRNPIRPTAVRFGYSGASNVPFKLSRNPTAAIVNMNLNAEAPRQPAQARACGIGSCGVNGPARAIRALNWAGTASRLPPRVALGIGTSRKATL